MNYKILLVTLLSASLFADKQKEWSPTAKVYAGMAGASALVTVAGMAAENRGVAAIGFGALTGIGCAAAEQAGVPMILS